MNREILDAIEEQTDLRYDSLADAAGWYGTTTAWREDFTANWNSTGPKRAVKRQLNRDKEAEEMAKAKIKIKVSDSGIVTLAASGDGYATLNALVEVLAATICEASTRTRPQACTRTTRRWADEQDDRVYPAEADARAAGEACRAESRPQKSGCRTREGP